MPYRTPGKVDTSPVKIQLVLSKDEVIKCIKYVLEKKPELLSKGMFFELPSPADIETIIGTTKQVHKSGRLTQVRDDEKSVIMTWENYP